jgi:hypothetical protein
MQTRGPYPNPYTIVLDAPHDALHSGYVFDVSLRTTLGNTEAMEIALTCPAGIKPHVVFDVASEKLATFSIIESVVDLAAGTAAVFYNANRNSAVTSGITGKTGIPATAMTYTGGTTIHTRQITTTGFVTESNFMAERVLKESASTVFRLVAAVASCDASISLRFYVQAAR